MLVAAVLAVKFAGNDSGALSYLNDFTNRLTWNQIIKDCTDVIWKINEDNIS